MRQILFEIPLRAPWFGFGYLLLAWSIFGVISLRRDWQRLGGMTDDLKQSIAFGIAVAVAIAFVPQFAPMPKVPVYGYGAMLVVGALLSGWVAATRSKLVGVDPQFAWDMSVKLILAGVIGSRLFYLLQYHDRVYARCENLFDYAKSTVNLTEGGLVLYGGLILGSAMYFVGCRLKGIDPVKFGDAVVPAVFVGEACGRLGCFLNGCCFGDPCDLPWGICFAQDSVPWRALVDRGYVLETATATFPLHPTQIYSSLNAVVLAVVTATYYRYRSGHGSVLALAIMGYAMSRSCLEVLRGDELGQFGTVLTISQWVSIGVFCSGAALAWWSWRQSDRRLPSPPASV